MKYTNNTGIPLSIAVWLATDTYDHDDRVNAISTTSLLKPLRQLILSSRITDENKTVDISSQIANSIGTAIHDAIEAAWINNYAEAMKSLGYPQRLIDRIRINPEEVTEDIIPVFMELRSEKEIEGMIVTGKFDFLSQEKLEDFKYTGTYTYEMGNKEDDYIKQMSIYRWLNPDKVTEEFAQINFIFKDFKAYEKYKPSYPNNDIMGHFIKLMSIEETEQFVKSKIRDLKKYWNADESTLPACTPADLWQDKPTYKYYKNPNKTEGRSTKNYDNYHEAHARQLKEGGVVITKEAEAKACKYCSGFALCKQKDHLIASGALKL